MEKNLYFDICAIIIMLILFFSIFLHKMTKGRVNRIFIFTIVCCMLAAIFDIGCEAFGIWFPITERNETLRYLLFYGYFAFRNLTGLMYVLYLLCLTDTWHLVWESKHATLLVTVPYGIILGALATNPWTNAVFYFDQNMNYCRGEQIYILYACSFFYLACGLIHVLRYRRLFTVIKFIALLSLFPLTSSAILIQLLLPHMMVEVFATVIALLFAIITVQRPEENVHPVLGVSNLHAHVFEMQRSFHNQKRFDMIFVRVRNHFSTLTILGYDVAQQLLLEVTGEMQKICKKNKATVDFYYLENGNFALVLSENRNLRKTEQVAREINEKLKENIQIDNYTLALQAQVCVIHCPEDFSDYQTLSSFETTFPNMIFSSVEVIMASKIIFQNDFRMQSELGSIISRALTNKSFEVYYQPIYSVERKCFVSAEALIRLKDEQYGFVPPGLFIPASEKNGTIYQIGEYVFEEVCRFINSADFQRLGFECIEINLSVAQCMQPDLAKRLIQIAKENKITPSLINLEITETAVENSKEIMLKNLKDLEEAGFRFSLDDYGTGYSNIQRIATLPLDIVKLDKSFADKLEQNDMQIILSNTVRMLKDLNLRIIVEGVETVEQLQFLTELNCDYIQGFYFSRPLPKEQFVSFVNEKNVIA